MLLLITFSVWLSCRIWTLWTVITRNCSTRTEHCWPPSPTSVLNDLITLPPLQSYDRAATPLRHNCSSATIQLRQGRTVVAMSRRCRVLEATTQLRHKSTTSSTSQLRYWTRILVEATTYRRLWIGRDEHLDRSENYCRIRCLLLLRHSCYVPGPPSSQATATSWLRSAMSWICLASIN